MTGSSDLRCRIDGYCIRSVSEDDDNFEIVAAYDGVESSLSIGDVDRDEAVEVALCGLRLDYVRREIGLGTATAADVRTAIEDAAVLGHGDDDVSDLIEAFMLLASEEELDAWREEKVRRLSDEMDEAEAAHRADPRPILVDAETVEVWSSDPALNGTTLVVSTVAEPDSFELVVADLLPDDDAPTEELGAMYRRAFDKAEANVALIEKVATMLCRPGDLEILERDEASRRNVLDRAREIIGLVRDTPAPDTITLSRGQLMSALREAAAQGMDNTSGPSCEQAASCREVADEIVEAIEAGRFSPDTYVYAFVDEQKAIQRARRGATS